MTEKICDKHISKSTEQFIRFYERLQQEPKVNVGDIIILVGGPKKVRKETYGVVEKYKVNSIHPSGLVIASRVLPNGKFGKSGIVNDGWWSVQVDDQFIESVIMDAEDLYDPSTSIKNLEEEKKRVTKYNRSISKRITSPEEAEEFLKGLKVGESFWKSDNYIWLKERKITILSKPERKLHNRYYVSNNVVYYEFMADVTMFGRHHSSNYGYTLDEFVGTIVTKQEPMKVEETK